jgi:hypothetical protein
LKQPRKSINSSKHISLSINNKTPTNETQENQNKTPESKTSDVMHIFVHDDRLTLRINSKLKEAFLRHCKAKGVSVCHILEGLIYGYLRGFYEKIDTDVKCPTINLTLVRDVKRVRRYAVEPESVAECELSSKRWYCCLFDEHVSVESLPLTDCFKCPNSGCRDYVLKLKTRGE